LDILEETYTYDLKFNEKIIFLLIKLINMLIL